MTVRKRTQSESTPQLGRRCETRHGATIGNVPRNDGGVSYRPGPLSTGNCGHVPARRLQGTKPRETPCPKLRICPTLAPGTSALAMGGLLMDAQELLGRRVDVLTEAGLHPALRARVLADALPL